MTTLIFIALFVSLGGLIVEMAHIHVFGSFIPDSKLGPFFERNISKYMQSTSSELLHGHIPLPFISKSSPSLLSRWYINDIGTIPRWSKYSKLLDTVWSTNYVKPRGSSLADF